MDGRKVAHAPKRPICVNVLVRWCVAIHSRLCAKFERSNEICITKSMWVIRIWTESSPLMVSIGCICIGQMRFRGLWIYPNRIIAVLQLAMLSGHLQCNVGRMQSRLGFAHYKHILFIFIFMHIILRPQRALLIMPGTHASCSSPKRPRIWTLNIIMRTNPVAWVCCVSRTKHWLSLATDKRERDNYAQSVSCLDMNTEWRDCIYVVH